MRVEGTVMERVLEARRDTQAADQLIRDYLPFIRAQASRVSRRICRDGDDEVSIAMIAFHEAIQSYSPLRGSFLHYAGLMIRSRLTDYWRREARHRGHDSLDEPYGEEETALRDRIADDRDAIAEREDLSAVQWEIAELTSVLARFSLTLTDAAENSPRQERTLAACRKVVQCARSHPELLDELLVTGRLPMARLEALSHVDRKTMERHRKYLVIMLLIQTNGYERIREHLRGVLALPRGKEE